MESCVFCKIVKGEIPCFRVWEDEENLAFLSIQQMKNGHTLVIPKKHFNYIFEMDNSLYQSLMSASKEVAKLLKEKFQPKTGKIGMLVYGMDVPHVHIHLSPIDKPGDLNLARAKMTSNDKLRAVLEKIKS